MRRLRVMAFMAKSGLAGTISMIAYPETAEPTTPPGVTQSKKSTAPKGGRALTSFKLGIKSELFTRTSSSLCKKDLFRVRVQGFRGLGFRTPLNPKP